LLPLHPPGCLRVKFRRSTKVYEELVAGGGLRLLSVSSDVIALEGGLPLLQNGLVIGSIGVYDLGRGRSGSGCRRRRAVVRSLLGGQQRAIERRRLRLDARILQRVLQKVEQIDFFAGGEGER
jgi:hypothetical protein